MPNKLSKTIPNKHYKATPEEKWQAVMEAKLAMELLKFAKMGDAKFAEPFAKLSNKEQRKLEKERKHKAKESKKASKKERKKESKQEANKANAKKDQKLKETKNAKIKKPFTNKSREALHGYFFIMLWLIGVMIFTLWPIIQAFYYSLCEATFKGSGIASEFRWFDNFIYAFSGDAKFPTMIRSYLLEIVIQVPFALTIALLIAMMLNQKIKLRGLWRLVFFLPVIIISGPVISELIGQGTTSINISGGAIGNFITNTLPPFLSKIIVLLFDKLIIVLWYTGIPILIFLAGLQRLNKQIYEAADIDGASSWQKFWKITLPSMSPFVLVNAVYLIVTLSNSSLAQSTTEVSSQTIPEYISSQYLDTMGKGYGYACALGVIYLVAILLHIGLYAFITLPKGQKAKKQRKIKHPKAQKLVKGGE